MLSKSELKEACETAEKESASSEVMQILREMLPTLRPDQCPSDAREDWLELNLMVQPRPLVTGPAWPVRLRQWMSRLTTPAPGYSLAPACGR
ncbi:hypothetical protein JST97_26685 [bacterium]|nr:hypothetical protein [bacterium]